jgi:hypothetical protein
LERLTAAIEGGVWRAKGGDLVYVVDRTNRNKLKTTY